MRLLPRALAFAAAVGASLTCPAAEPGFGSITYAGGRVFKTGVYKPTLLAELPSAGTEPFLVIAGLGCNECDINLSVYIHSPAQGAMLEGERAPRYSYPGQYRDYMSKDLVESVRMFVGRCTSDQTVGVVWLQNTKLASGKWRRGAYVAKIEGTALVESSEPTPTVSLNAVQAAVSQGACREIPGKRFTTEP